MRTKKISVREKFAYGLGDTASNIVFQAVVNVLMYFYTDVYGIEAAAAGTLMVVVRLIDAVTDPVMGAIADRTQSKYGRYRPWMLWIALPYGALAVAAFITPDVSAELKLIYAYISYTLMMAAYTAINIPYSALGGGGPDANLQLGFPFAMSIMAVIAVLCFFGCFAWTKERYYPDQDKPKVGMFRDIGAMFKNSQWVIVSLIMFIVQIRGALQGGSTPYFIKYYLNTEMTGVFSTIENLMSLFMALGMAAGLTGVIFANQLILRLNWCKVSVMKLSLVGNILINCALFLVARDAWQLALVLTMANMFFHMMFIPLLFSTVPDTVDYGLIVKGTGAMAMFFAGQLFALKAGISVGGGLTGWILSLFGYQANVEQTETALLGIKVAFAGSAVVAGIVSLLCLQFYKLKKGWKESLV